MIKKNLWKLLLILVLLLMCWMSLSPYGWTGQYRGWQLKAGLDLRGGTLLVYEVNVPADAMSREAAIEQTIGVLRRRIDPTGVRSLAMRQTGGNRIEIQMPMASPETAAKRQAYQDRLRELLTGNIDRVQLESALGQADAASRSAALLALGQGNPRQEALLKALAEASEAYHAARAPYDQAQEAYRQLQARLDALPADTAPAAKQALEQQVQAALEKAIALAETFNQTRKPFDEAQRAVLATDIAPGDVERVLTLAKTARDADGKAITPRQTALNDLVARYPGRAQQIQAVASAYELYEGVKGQLDDPNDLIALLRGAGVIEFRIAPRSGEVGPIAAQYREQLRTKGPRFGQDLPYRWFRIDDLAQFAKRASEVEAITKDPATYLAQTRQLVGASYGGEVFVLLGNTRANALTSALDGWKITSVGPSWDDNHFPAVAFNLNPIGGNYMAALTGAHVGYPMAIVLDGRVLSTPNIQEKLSTGIRITGGESGFSPREQDYLVRTLSAGSLQAQISEEPVSIQTIGATFGEDNLYSGLKAAIWSFIAVGGFMLVYYLFVGAVANFALVANILIVLGVMSMLDATFTLGGIAGIVLTIGMAVDANVLIYERIREELERKAEVHTAVRLGFEKALSTIIDSNLTTLITCVILGYTATADIKGFAVTLGIGIVANVFTAVICSRVLIELYMEIAKPRTLHMLALDFPSIRNALHPSFDWYGKRYLFFGLSAATIAVGIVAMYTRGADMLDIEFRAGTQVSFELARTGPTEFKTLALAEVRARLTAQSEKARAAELHGDRVTVVPVGEAVNGKYHAFKIATLLQDRDLVSDTIKEAFADVLDTQRPISFRGIANESVNVAPVHAVTSAALGDNIDRPLMRQSIGEYLGGVAIVLDELQPPATLADLTRRLDIARLQPGRPEGINFRKSTLIGLDLAPGAGVTGDPLYKSVVILVRDDQTNYAENPSTLTDKDGLADTEWQLVREGLQRDTSLGSVTNIQPSVSGTMRQQAIVAMVLSSFAILVYIWFRFGSVRYGLAAILATLHDVAVALSLMALSVYLADTAIGNALMITPFRIDLTLIAAILTLIGYSLNDTIVIFDRIRENRGRLAVATPAIINDSINQTVSRTVLTAGTTAIACIFLYAIGGPGVHGFAFVMTAGVIIGTYSSVAIASPLLLIGSRPGAPEPAPTPVKASVVSR